MPALRRVKQRSVSDVGGWQLLHPTDERDEFPQVAGRHPGIDTCAPSDEEFSLHAVAALRCIHKSGHSVLVALVNANLAGGD